MDENKKPSILASIGVLSIIFSIAIFFLLDFSFRKGKREGEENVHRAYEQEIKKIEDARISALKEKKQQFLGDLKNIFEVSFYSKNSGLFSTLPYMKVKNKSNFVVQRLVYILRYVDESDVVLDTELVEFYSIFPYREVEIQIKRKKEHHYEYAIKELECRELEITYTNDLL